ncbi:MAG: hypothetical protein H6970_04220 [Gammaproteobacteria bacterium]|nr:hypothetical protein [Gammaproteobacteria bacterium]MCP5424254.1 hypothetical protein [Gammaproteobacteria bacterium]MCP5458872.1 hypothetical protein [Gammaproteobacteria bacterium]
MTKQQRWRVLNTFLLMGLISAATAATNSVVFTNTVSMGTFKPEVQVTPPAEKAPKSPREGELLDSGTEVRTLEKAEATIMYSCELALPSGKGYVLADAKECALGDDSLLKNGADVPSPNADKTAGSCDEPIAYIREWWPGIKVNGSPLPEFEEGKIQRLCANDSVVAGETPAKIVYPCTLVMQENNQLTVGDGTECALGGVLVTQAGPIGEAVTTAAAVGGGLMPGAAIGGVIAAGGFIIGHNDGNGGQISPSSP